MALLSPSGPRVVFSRGFFSPGRPGASGHKVRGAKSCPYASMGYTRAVRAVECDHCLPKETTNVGAKQSLGGCGCRLQPVSTRLVRTLPNSRRAETGIRYCRSPPLDGHRRTRPGTEYRPQHGPLSLRQPPGALRLRTCARPAFRPPNHRRARPTKQCSLRARVENLLSLRRPGEKNGAERFVLV